MEGLASSAMTLLKRRTRTTARALATFPNESMQVVLTPLGRSINRVLNRTQVLHSAKTRECVGSFLVPIVYSYYQSMAAIIQFFSLSFFLFSLFFFFL